MKRRHENRGKKKGGRKKKKARHTNQGLRKLCGHPRRAWAACPHSWFFNFKPRDPARRNPKTKDGGYRLSLDRHAGKHIDSKTDAEDLAADLRKQIREGKFGQPVAREAMTLRQLADTYLERFVAVEHADTVEDFRSGLRVICSTPIARPTSGAAPLGDWPLADIVTDTIERYREARRAAGTGPGGTNRSLSRLRALYAWAVRVGYVDRTPYKRSSETVVKLSRETPRSRRLNADLDEAAKLLAACDPHLRAVVEAALETGMRRGEILGLRWSGVEGMRIEDNKIVWAPRPEIVLLAAQTKTKRNRKIPISTRLKSVLEMRRCDPAGQPHALDRFVFGNAIGQPIQSTTRAWHTAVLKAHGLRPSYTATMNLTPASRAALQQINLHFHDLRREAGSRWMDAGVPIATIQRWLGHQTVAQTSTYLAGTSTSEHAAMAAFEAHQAGLQRRATDVGKGDQKRLPSAARRKGTPSKTADDRDPRIM